MKDENPIMYLHKADSPPELRAVSWMQNYIIYWFKIK